MQVTLSEEAKRRIIFKACIDAKDKILPTAIVEWKDPSFYECLIYLVSKMQIMKTVGHFHKKQVTIDTNLETQCVSIKISNMNDIHWGEIRIKALTQDYDLLAEEVARNLEQYTPVVLIINNSSRIESLNNPSKR